MKINVISVPDWELIVAIGHYGYIPNLPQHLVDKAYKAAWQYTDAYGKLGFMPSQGYDWSGFRDSSRESNRLSANAIRVVLAKAGVDEFKVSLLGCA